MAAVKTAQKRVARRNRYRASTTYLALARAYPIHPIRSEEDLNEAVFMLDKLLRRTRPLDDQEQGYMESLTNEIERYEAAHVPVPEVSGVAMLQHLIQSRELTLSEVARSAGIAVSTLSSVMNGKRILNRDHIEKLARYFGVEPGVFLD